MMQLPNGQWALLAGNEKADTTAADHDESPTMATCNGYQYRLAGVVTSAGITDRWCRIVL